MKKLILAMTLTLAIAPMHAMQQAGRQSFNFMREPLITAIQQKKSMKRFVPYILVGGGLGAYIGYQNEPSVEYQIDKAIEFHIRKKVIDNAKDLIKQTQNDMFEYLAKKKQIHKMQAFINTHNQSSTQKDTSSSDDDNQ